MVTGINLILIASVLAFGLGGMIFFLIGLKVGFDREDMMAIRAREEGQRLERGKVNRLLGDNDRLHIKIRELEDQIANSDAEREMVKADVIQLLKFLRGTRQSIDCMVGMMEKPTVNEDLPEGETEDYGTAVPAGEHSDAGTAVGATLKTVTDLDGVGERMTSRTEDERG